MALDQNSVIQRITLTLEVYTVNGERRLVTFTVEGPPTNSPLYLAAVDAWQDWYDKEMVALKNASTTTTS